MTGSHLAKEQSVTVEEVLTGGDGGQKGVFAARDMAAGARIAPFTGVETRTRSRMSLQFGRDLHVEPAETCLLRFLNHACNPNAVFVENERVLVARRAIRPGEEITIDYTCHEDALAEPFPCRCGAPDCLGMVRGWKHLGPPQRAIRRERAGSWLLPEPFTDTLRKMFCNRGTG
jgi:hypothetical protein